MGVDFEVVATWGRARAGMIHTAHGPIETPAFLPVGTAASVKGLTPRDLEGVGVQALLANAYHLWLRPGTEVVERAGGLHTFMGWGRPIVTDSGGFQTLSLSPLARLDETGVTFRSHLDGTEVQWTPELAVQVQTGLGVDVAMVLDVCLPFPSGAAELREATERTVRWAERSLTVAQPSGPALFGIVQGGINLDLRRWCAERLAQLPFDGYGIGGLSVGEGRPQTWSVLEASVDTLPHDRPRYLMGVGAPRDLAEAVSRGVDLFDCVLPTRLGRHGTVLTVEGRINLRSGSLRVARGPIDPECDCPACTGFELGYLHHLVRCGEHLGLRLASMHNIRFLTRLLARARQAILEGRFAGFW